MSQGSFARDFQQPYRLPPAAKRLVLVRHGSSGESGAAAERFTEGWADAGLTELGKEQAKALACRLSRIEPEVKLLRLFHTGLHRTVHTAAPTRDAIGSDATAVEDLREIKLGPYDGRAFEEARLGRDPLMERAWAEERWDVLTGAESMDAFTARVTRGITEVLTRVPSGGTGIVFTHGGVIAEVCSQVCRSRRFAFVDVDNGSLTTLVWTAERDLQLRSFNDTAHLDDRAAN